MQTKTTNKLSVTVAVPSVGRPEVLKNCLQGLISQTVPPDVLLVICRREDTATRAIAGDYGADVKLVTRPGVTFAVQTAIRTASTDLLCLTDDDAIPPEDWVAHISAAFSTDARLGILGGRDILPSLTVATENSSLRVGLLHRGKMHGNHHLGHGQLRGADYPKGVNMALRITAVKKVPLSDLVVGVGAQVGYEVILGFAAKKAGFEVMYDPNLTVRHFPAERPVKDDRRIFSWEKVYERAHNRMIALVVYGSLKDMVFHSVHSLTWGDRMNPGISKFLVLWPREIRNAPVRFCATFSGIARAWKTGWNYRRRRLSAKAIKTEHIS